ncbi:hypothetical protein [Nonomuraea helvata]|uniref:Uncharacterized protein n=1 Tax=Nonomuraea helvata TaxID=37484 RepID=A0ABV5RRQ1_9ACTN
MTAIALTLAVGAPCAQAADARHARHATLAVRALTLSMTAPTTASLGSAGAKGTISATLGTVTVVDSRPGNPLWTATVSATDFTTSGPPAGTIAKGNIAYWSGPITAQSGASNRTPGQPTAADRVSLSALITAFSARKLLAVTTSTSWKPTLVVTIPVSAVSGTYTGTITHSVA